MLLALGTIGSIASIISLFLPATTLRQRVIHAIYCGAIFVLAILVTNYQLKIRRIESIERTASQMVAEQDNGYTHLGYVQASLAFLEKNKDLYPDTYQRALDMCTAYKCSEPGGNTDIVSMAFAMSGILKGLATIDGGS